MSLNHLETRLTFDYINVLFGADLRNINPPDLVISVRACLNCVLRVRGKHAFLALFVSPPYYF